MPKRKSTFITEAIRTRGYGHLMRCLELARQLEATGRYECNFLLADIDTSAAKRISQEKFSFSSLMLRSTSDLNMHDISTHIKDTRLIIIDIPPERTIKKGWRHSFLQDKKILVLDSVADWAIEADLIVIPGASGQKSCDGAAHHKPKIRHGVEFTIIRQEIKRVKKLAGTKDIDVVAYLHHKDVLEVVATLLRKASVSHVMISRFTHNFFELLARAKVYISGFGISFYEALYLGAYPVTIPHSKRHEKEAMIFYREMGLDEAIVPPDHMDKLLATIRQAKIFLRQSQLPIIQDGTPNIINEIEELFS